MSDAYTNEGGDLICSEECHHDWTERHGGSCGGPWKRVSAQMVADWQHNLAEQITEEVVADPTITSGIDPSHFILDVARVRCDVCGRGIVEEEDPATVLRAYLKAS